MKTEIRLTVETVDEDLIQTVLPEDPCNTCPDYNDCFEGCSSNDVYHKKMRLLKEANVDDYDPIYNKIVDIDSKIHSLMIQKQKLLVELKSVINKGAEK